MERTYELTSLLSEEQSIDERCSLFDSYLTMCIQTNYGSMTEEDYQSVLKNENLFPSISDVFKIAVERSHVATATFLRMSMEPHFHSLTMKDGKSALHFLVKNSPCKYHRHQNELTTSLVRSLLTTAEENLFDAYGFTYFHGACLFGDVEIVQKFIGAGVDVNLDSYAYSPLHVAVEYRRVEVVRVLLEHGADPNKLDTEGESTALHVLAKRRVCDCLAYCTNDTDCEAIVDLLVSKGANIEAQASEQSPAPLDCAVSHLDLDLARSLLKRGARVNGKSLENMFNYCYYTPDELVNFAITSHFVEMIRLLISYGFEMDLCTRLRILKCWKSIRGNTTDHLILNEYSNGDYTPRVNEVWNNIHFHLLAHEKLGFFAKQEALEYLHEARERMRPTVPETHKGPEFFEMISNNLEAELTIMKLIMLTEDISLYQLCRMSYMEGSSILTKIRNWPSTELNYMEVLRTMVKKHLANIFMRLQFELFAADLYMTDHCKLDLPYAVCRTVAKHTTDEELFRLCEQTYENDLCQQR
ncbi:hypothetical protein TKK_0004710 [Trichogramma kaykai]